MHNFQLFIRKNIIKGSTVVVGVSGGPDSLALLHLFLSIKKEYSLKIVGAHVDHMFRAEQSEEEMLFVKDFCCQYNIPCEAKQIDIPAYLNMNKISSQAASREHRYNFYKEVMDAYNANYLALGHHGDDQIETILMRMVRGSTGEAIAGMKAVRKFHNGYIVRPLLTASKEEILQYCDLNGLEPRFDPSNEENKYTRNRFRNTVLPFLKSENPLVHERFQYFSETFLEDELYLQELTKEKMNTVLKRKEKSEVEMDTKLFLNLPLPLQRRCIQLILNYLYETIPSSLSSIHIESLLSLLSRDHPSGSLDYPNGLRVIKSYDNCLFTFDYDKSLPYEIPLSIPSTIILPNGSAIDCGILKKPHSLKRGNDVFFLSVGRLKEPLTIRSRKQGDKIKLKGMNGTKKVKDIFIDEKIPLHNRDIWPILEDGDGNILWVPGLKKSVFEEADCNGDYIFLQYKEL
ncbi:tRNA lysidine(34) synthetase TilS [Metabacillus fastidiosus]|uniref:tRNA lysidine(34) synthetase TilS n=1 Tax=Metabacillus fastidiosus TaxID=1458 RepID=UPI002E22579B|nr:tRNA lysidine(34) synthetase TilS [Metabacillus fastidiosus]MED4533432.1 tRNA lysidine(34) synthetase TilS [Metabacillus fastidiosus]